MDDLDCLYVYDMKDSHIDYACLFSLNTLGQLYFLIMGLCSVMSLDMMNPSCSVMSDTVIMLRY